VEREWAVLAFRDLLARVDTLGSSHTRMVKSSVCKDGRRSARQSKMCNALTGRHPEVAERYARAHAATPADLQGVLAETTNGLYRGGESVLQRAVDEHWLRSSLGPELTTDQVEAPEGPARPGDLFAIVSKTSRFVAAVRAGRLDRVVDRPALASQIATTMLLQQLNSSA